MPEIIAPPTPPALRAGPQAAGGAAPDRRLPAGLAAVRPVDLGDSRAARAPRRRPLRRAGRRPPGRLPRPAAPPARPRRRLLVGLAAVCLAFVAARGAPAQPAVAGDGAHHGYLAARMTGDGGLEVIDALNAGRFFVPASVLKVVAVAAALEHLGADYRWRTHLTVDGGGRRGAPRRRPRHRAGRRPDLEPGPVPPAGRTNRWRRWRPRCARAASSRIRGDLVVDAGRFPGRPHPLDRGYGDLPYRFRHPARPPSPSTKRRSRCAWRRGRRSGRRPASRRPTA